MGHLLSFGEKRGREEVEGRWREKERRRDLLRRVIGRRDAREGIMGDR